MQKWWKDYNVTMRFVCTLLIFIDIVLCELTFWHISEWGECETETDCFGVGIKRRSIRCANVDNVTCSNNICTETLGYTPRILKYCVPEACYSKVSTLLKKKTLRWSACIPMNINTINKTLPVDIDLSKSYCPKHQLVIPFLKHRKIKCTIQYDNVSVALDFKTCKRVYNIEKEWRGCFYSCVNSCYLSAWSKWKNCEMCRNGYVKYKVRTHASIHTIEQFEIKCAPLIKRKTRTKKRMKVQYFISSWNEGSTVHKGKRHQNSVTFSVAQRNVACIQNDGKKCLDVDNKISMIKLMQTRRDCEYSHWSKWSHCRFDRITSVKYRERHREISLLPVGDGSMPCALLNERKKCYHHNQNKNKHKFDWLIADWGTCTKRAKILGCEVQYEQRDVFCANISHEYLKPVSTKHCLSLKKPSSERICKVKCLTNCGYSHWSGWTKCDNNTKYRYRLSSNHNKHEKCDHVTQRRFCSQFYWKMVNSTRCILETHKTCGEGLKQHVLQCFNVSEGEQQIVPTMHCDNSTRPQAKESCYKACHDDCIVDTWSPWKYKNLTKSRTRTVILNVHNKTCDKLVEEVKYQGHFAWVPTNWGSCETNFSKTVHGVKSNGSCFSGHKKRDIKCMNVFNNVLANESYCRSYLKPNLVKPCNKCKKDCVLSAWTDWEASCKSTCNLYHTEIQPRVTKRRYIIQQHNRYGEPCTAPLVKFKSCQLCPNFQWIVSKWNDCMHNTVPTFTLGDEDVVQKGLQVRNVYCSDGEKRTNDQVCLDLDQPKPTEVRECETNWLVTCVLKPWSDWSECDVKCGGGKQTRHRKMDYMECESKENMRDERNCNTQVCRSYQYHIGEWSGCQPVFINPATEQSRFSINLGIQHRNVSCSTLNGSIVANQYCEDIKEEKMLAQRNCIVPPKRIRTLTAWSTYSECSSTCGFGTKKRFRTVTKLSKRQESHSLNYGGVITQIQPCKQIECIVYSWKTSPWNNCKLGNNTCGEGKIDRTVWCSNGLTTVDDSFCEQREKPNRVDLCETPCQNGCILSSWSPWSQCNNNKISRNRTVLVNSKNTACSKLLDERSTTCIIYSWNATSWSTCTLPKAEDTCGLGIQVRSINCLKNGRFIVQSYYCNHLAQEELFRECEIDCVKDCELSWWSSWSSCDVMCESTAYRSRKRNILAREENGGNPCNTMTLNELIQCPVYPCYTMEVSHWSECKAELKDSCGTGIQSRKAVCIRGDGNKVALEYCRDYVTGRHRIRKSCSIPCWNDCITTGWHAWSSCFGFCNNNSQLLLARGVRTRSRSILQTPLNDGTTCPDDLDQQESCIPPKCYTFSISKNKVDRTYECLRSDNLTLSLGCTFSNKTLKHRCKCPVANAKCVHKNYCRCYYGFTAKLVDDILVSCYSNAVKASAKAIGFPVVTWLIAVGCLVYCLLVVFVVLLYKRHRNKSKWIQHQERQKSLTEGLPLTSLTEMDDVKFSCMKRSRHLLSTLPSESSQSSGISSADESELQWSIDNDGQSLLNYHSNDQQEESSNDVDVTI